MDQYNSKRKDPNTQHHEPNAKRVKINPRIINIVEQGDMSIRFIPYQSANTVTLFVDRNVLKRSSLVWSEELKNKREIAIATNKFSLKAMEEFLKLIHTPTWSAYRLKDETVIEVLFLSVLFQCPQASETCMKQLEYRQRAVLPCKKEEKENKMKKAMEEISWLEEIEWKDDVRMVALKEATYDYLGAVGVFDEIESMDDLLQQRINPLAMIKQLSKRLRCERGRLSSYLDFGWRERVPKKDEDNE